MDTSEQILDNLASKHKILYLWLYIITESRLGAQFCFQKLIRIKQRVDTAELHFGTNRKEIIKFFDFFY